MNLKESTIIICSIVRDAAYGLEHNIPVVNELCRHFRDYQIVVFENDSKDNTKQLLTAWQNSCPEKIHCIMQDRKSRSTIPLSEESTANPFFSIKRIAKMVDLRNQYMDYVEQQKMSADLLCVIDLDVAQLYSSPIIDTLSSDRNWDVLTAYGYSTSPSLKRRYHDGYAVTLNGKKDDIVTEDSIRESRSILSSLTSRDEWYNVYCAFGGASFYKYDAAKGLKYQLIKNNNERVEVRCEHYSLLKQIHDRGYNNVYVVPSMLLKYQRITFKSFWEKVLVRLKGNAI